MSALVALAILLQVRFSPPPPLSVTCGGTGSLLATVAIFLPAFVFVAVSAPFIPKLRASRRAAAFLDGANGASLALMAVVAAPLGAASLVDGPTVLIALLATGVLLRTRVKSIWLVLTGAVFGLLKPLL